MARKHARCRQTVGGGQVEGKCEDYRVCFLINSCLLAGSPTNDRPAAPLHGLGCDSRWSRERSRKLGLSKSDAAATILL